MTSTVRKRLKYLKPSPENDQLYRPVDPSDPEIKLLAESIARHGLREPLVVTLDNFILSGHRRHCAARLAGKVTVPCRVERIKRCTDPDKFLVLLREYNRQRDKTADEQLREELVTVDPHQAYQSLIDHRSQQAVPSQRVFIEGKKHRYTISEAKSEMVEHIRKVLFEDRKHRWPLTVRTVHYALLNYRFRRNIKRDLWYTNDKKSYQDLSNILTRMRLSGEVPWAALDDMTRPVSKWNVWPNVRGFIREQIDGFLKGYWRDLMQSQPNYVEAVVEKNSSYRDVCNVTSRYCIHTMSGRGFSGIDPWHDLYVRYRESGKDQLVVLVLSDFDPEGEEIVQVAGRTLRDDFGVRRLHIVKVAVTPDQIEKYDLPDGNFAKETSSRYQKFVEQHGENVYELEALPDGELEMALAFAIDKVIDTDAFSNELERERDDATFLEGVRRTVHEQLKALNLGDDDGSAHQNVDMSE